MPTRIDIVVLGAMNSDFLAKGDHFPRPGETVKGTAFLSAAGGKGANQAVAAVRLGARVALISCVGKDSRGKELRDRLRVEGVNIRHVHQTLKADTGAAVILIDRNGEKQILAIPGANDHISVAHVNAAKSLIASAKVLLLQFEAPIKTVVAAARVAHKAGVKVVLDPAPPVALPKALSRLLHAIRPNSHEASTLTGIKVDNRSSALKAAQKLQRLGIKTVAVQAGEEGNWLLWGNETIWLPKIRVKSVDATGAGDAFAAALAVAIAEGQPAAKAGRFCSAAAALTTTRIGAQPALPTRAAVDAKVKAIK